MPGRIGVDAPVRSGAVQSGGTDVEGGPFRRVHVVDRHVGVGLLRTVLVRPAGRHVAGGPLQADPPAVTRVEGDPLIVIVGDAWPGGELLVEGGREVDVRGVQRHVPQ